MPMQSEDARFGPPAGPDSSPISIEHLSRITMGDKDLEREVLTMFLSQSANFLVRLADLPDHAGDIAHSLKGSAGSIGAMKVAQIAQELEMTLQAGENAEAVLAKLAESVDQARTRIKKMLGFI